VIVKTAIMSEIPLKVLCLGFWSPPLIRPRAILLGKIIPEWLNQGIKPVVVTYDNGGQWNVEAPVYRISQFGQRGKLKQNFFIRSVSKYFYYRRLTKEIAILIEKHKINLIFSFAIPQESNILGAMLKRKTGIKFISHFSDPWYDNPYKIFKGFNARKVLKLERFIIKNSSRVIFTNRQAKELVMKKYPLGWGSKALVVSHCYDPKDYPLKENLAEEPGKEYLFSYVGAFYKERNPEILFKIFSRLKQNKNIRKFKFRLIGGVNEYAGYSESELKKKIKEYGLEEIVEIIPTVSHRESLRYMVESDCLITIDANFSNSPFLPSKVIDYVGSKKPILGITPKGSPTEELLESVGYKNFTYGQEEQLEKYLTELLEGKIKNNNSVLLNKFSVQAITAKLKNIFLETIN